MGRLNERNRQIVYFFLGKIYFIDNNSYMDIIVNGCKLDNEQEKIVLDDGKNLLVVAGAGSGKSLTIVGKVKYLVNSIGIDPSRILCISFTNASVLSLKEKIGMNVDVMTFHKLALSIFELNNIRFNICPSSYLEYITHEFFFGIIFESEVLMKKMLSYFKIRFYFNTEIRYSKFLKDNYDKIISFERLVVKFIRLFKTNNYSLNSFIEFRKCSHFRKENLFLSIALNVYLVYMNELNSNCSIDFDDMITASSKMVSNGGAVRDYDFIIIDEYQDTSYIRYLLIKNILNRTGARFMAVGDDFQSIYRFSGCTLDLFVNFNKYFSDANMLKIQSTYRNSRELISVAGRFIMKNKMQIRKEMNSSISNPKPIKLCYIPIKNLLDTLDGDIMILGRTNNDIYDYIDEDLTKVGDNIFYNKRPELTITYLTIHRSKGLESNNVILLNVVDSLMGIPNTIADDRVLRYVSRSGEYLYDEERRLFYVAITRTRNNVYLMTKKFHESMFIHEIVKSDFNYIEVVK